MAKFNKTVEVRWSDIDMNRHVRHSAYADFCTHVRVEWLTAMGFPPERFAELGFGPVIFREETEYYREVHLGERITVDVELSGASADNGRFRFRHHVIKPDGQVAATHEILGAWLDLRARKLIVPPPAMAEVLAGLERSPNFSEIVPASRKAAQA